MIYQYKCIVIYSRSQMPWWIYYSSTVVRLGFMKRLLSACFIENVKSETASTSVQDIFYEVENRNEFLKCDKTFERIFTKNNQGLTN